MRVVINGHHIPFMGAALRIEDYVGEPPKVDLGSRLASAADSLAKVEQSVQRLKSNLDRLYLAVQDLPPEEISAGADSLLEMERLHAETMVPWIKAAEGRIDATLKRSSLHTAIEKSYMRQQERFANAVSLWLETLRDARIRLHLLASEKMRKTGAPDVDITDDADLDSYFRNIAAG